MKINLKRFNKEATLPQYSKQGDAAMDLTAISRSYDGNGNVMYGTGIGIEIPRGFVGLLFPRSSVSKKDLTLANSVGVIDSGYRGEIIFKFKPALAVYDNDGEGSKETKDLSAEAYIDVPVIEDFGHYKVGERIGQILILPYPEIEFNEVDELSSSIRGEGGFGSTGA